MLDWIEHKINEYGEDQGTLEDFVFSGKNSLEAALDVCRTVTRRSEREAVSILRHSDQYSQKILPVLNRLSSLFFTMRLFAGKL
jgi:cob(I)alamin adenosyltransferase